MKILIAGSGGQLGTEFVKILKPGKTDAVFGKVLLFPFNRLQLDITHSEKVLKTVREIKPDIIINCAAFTDVNGCESDSEKAFNVNAKAVKNLAISAQEVGAKFVHISTDYVFSSKSDKPFCETDKVNPVNVYGKSKVLGEEYALKYCEKSFVVRTAWLYGGDGKNFVKTVMNILKEKGEITVINDKFGNPTNVNDLAKHILKIVLTDNFGIYHCVGKGMCSRFEFAQKIAELSGIKADIKPISSKQYNSEHGVKTKRPKYSLLENKKLKATVGDNMRQWETALKEYIKEQEK